MTRSFGSPEARDRLRRDLGLSTPSGFSQDWEYHVADRKRVREFVTAYKATSYGPDEQFLLMRIIVQSIDDAIRDEEELDPSLWDEVASLLIRDSGIHESTIEYWSLWDADDGGLGEESWFAVTSRMREVSKTIHKQPEGE